METKLRISIKVFWKIDAILLNIWDRHVIYWKIKHRLILEDIISSCHFPFLAFGLFHLALCWITSSLPLLEFRYSLHKSVMVLEGEIQGRLSWLLLIGIWTCQLSIVPWRIPVKIRQGTSSQYQYCYLDLVIWYYLNVPSVVCCFQFIYIFPWPFNIVYGPCLSYIKWYHDHNVFTKSYSWNFITTSFGSI